MIDVFTDTPLQGNQLAVFTDARERGPAVQFGQDLERLLPGYTFTASLAGWDDGRLRIEFDLEPERAPVS